MLIDTKMDVGYGSSGSVKKIQSSGGITFYLEQCQVAYSDIQLSGEVNDSLLAVDANTDVVRAELANQNNANTTYPILYTKIVEYCY